MIDVVNLTKSFRDLRRGLVHAVDRVSFQARPGEIFGLLGPNGAGKTTTMRILCTVLRPTGGTATVAGYDVVTQPALVRQHIGFMSANTAIYDRMSAWELVEYFGGLYGLEPGRLRALGKCVLFSTHIMREVERLCDRVAVISRGKVQACGTLAQLREQYGQDDLEELFFQLVS